MYIKEYAEKEEWDKEVPEKYDGHLFSRGQENAEGDDTSQEKEEQQPSPSILGGVQQTFSRLLNNFNLRGLFSSDMLLTAFAVWLLCNDREDDDTLFVILLFFLLR